MKRRPQFICRDEDMSLDVGAIAKGYATKCLAEKLKEAGVTSALLSLGGNVETIGTKADGKPWRVGVQNPDTSAAKAYLHVLKLTDTCLVTSGTYQRYYEVDGVRYHHIIDQDTLMPENTYDSVTILCNDSARADALSTAVFNMDPETGMAFCGSAGWRGSTVGLSRWNGGTEQWFRSLCRSVRMKKWLQYSQEFSERQ